MTNVTPMPSAGQQNPEIEKHKMRDLIDAQARTIASQATLIRHLQDLLPIWEEHEG
jgi:hypothetical protein